MNEIHSILSTIASIIDIIGVVILLYGFIKIILSYLIIEFKNVRNTPIKQLQTLRCEIGIYILLALDFLIASDIIHTITDLSQKQLLELSVIIVLRIAIGYFLGKEIKEIQDFKDTAGE